MFSILSFLMLTLCFNVINGQEIYNTLKVKEISENTFKEYYFIVCYKEAVNSKTININKEPDDMDVYFYVLSQKSDFVDNSRYTKLVRGMRIRVNLERVDNKRIKLKSTTRPSSSIIYNHQYITIIDSIAVDMYKCPQILNAYIEKSAIQK